MVPGIICMFFKLCFDHRPCGPGSLAAARRCSRRRSLGLIQPELELGTTCMASAPPSSCSPLDPPPLLPPSPGVRVCVPACASHVCLMRACSPPPRFEGRPCPPGEGAAQGALVPALPPCPRPLPLGAGRGKGGKPLWPLSLCSRLGNTPWREPKGMRAPCAFPSFGSDGP